MNNKSQEKILITGGAGYIGSMLTPALLTLGYKITVFDNLLYNQSSLLECCSFDNFEFIKGDITDYNLINPLLKKHDIILPLAAVVGASACENKKNYSTLVNRDSYINLLKNLSPNQKVIFPTTNSGYGIGSKESFCTEKTPLKPVSIYGQHKVEIEKLFLDSGNGITLRLATVFGMSPRMRTDLLVNNFVLKALKDRSIVLFEENFRRNYIHIKDIVNVFLFSIDNYKTMNNEPFNVGLSSANLTKKQLAEKIKEYIPNTYIHSAPIGEDPDKRDYVVSNEKIESIGWSASFDLEMGIKELIKGYKIINPNIFSNA
tara:strand:+ start:2530 stop:3480 length:951 start_codon:yes stop_codon:yes gene_type:complete